jgi:hypothetical protein
MQNDPKEPFVNWPGAYIAVLSVLVLLIGIFWWLTNRWQ